MLPEDDATLPGPKPPGQDSCGPGIREGEGVVDGGRQQGEAGWVAGSPVNRSPCPARPGAVEAGHQHQWQQGERQHSRQRDVVQPEMQLSSIRSIFEAFIYLDVRIILTQLPREALQAQDWRGSGQ